MAEKGVIDKTEDKLPNNLVDLSVSSNLEAAQEKKESLLGNKENKQKTGKGCLFCRYRKGRPYWYRITKVKTDGVWKNKEVYIGTRKPRE